MDFKSRTSRIVSALLLACGVSVFVATQSDRAPSFFFEANCRSATNGYVRLYCDLGGGFRDEDSGRAWITGGNIPAAIRIPVPRGRHRALRLDPLDRPGRMSVTDARIVDRRGRPVAEFPPSDFAALNQIADLRVTGRALEILTAPDATDPSLAINIAGPLDLDAYPTDYFEFKMRSSADTNVRLYFNIGRGIRDEDSAVIRVRGGDRFVACRLPIPDGRYRTLRLDPLDRAGRVSITDVRIADRKGRTIAGFPPESFIADNQIASLEERAGTLSVETTPGATDPILQVRLPRRLVLRAAWPARLAELAWDAAGWFAVCLLLFLPFAVKSRRIDGAVASAFSRGKGYFSVRPRAVILGVAFLAVCWSCYPVLFFGRSFASPNNRQGGIAMLYPAAPSLPGFEDRETENAMGSDTGNLMWQFAPYAFVQRRTLAGDRELPLWNRWSSCGNPLLGQGVSEFGDPLHLIVLLGGGSAWAWDLKFIAAKMLFATGVGLVGAALLGNAVVAALLAASAPFIGFFFFRMNHSAFFGMSYAPWILFFWMGLIRSGSWKPVAGSILGLTLANWALLHSGTVKEAYMLLVFLNLWGWLAIFMSPAASGLPRWGRVAAVGSGQVLFVIMASPTWVTFIRAIKDLTVYHVRPLTQVNPGVSIGIFDDIFLRQLNPGEIVSLPSLNFLLLLGTLWALSRATVLFRDRIFLATCLSSLVPAALAFGVVPAGIISRIPLLSGIYHVDNTFLCVLLVHLYLIAGYGIRECWRSSGSEGWAKDWTVAMILLAAVLALYFRTTAGLAKSGFFYADAIALTAAMAGMPWALRMLARTNMRSGRGMILFIALFAVIHWRHGMYVRTPFDTMVMNPQKRADLGAMAPSVAYVKGHLDQPGRVIGQNDIFYPHYGGIAGLEALSGADALINPWFRELVKASDGRLTWNFYMFPETIRAQRPLFDLLNTRYYLVTPGFRDGATAGLRQVASEDLDVYESPAAWPRAFFAGVVLPYRGVADFIGMVGRGDGRPFAAMEEGDWKRLPEWLARPVRHRRTVAATDYRLTGNATTFRIETPGRGLIVLSESYLRDDFVAELDGKRVEYVRVNHIFKGLVVDHPGKHEVSFRYLPRYWNATLVLSGAAFILFLALLAFMAGLDKRRTPG